MTDQSPADQWMTIRDAAAALGTSEGAVRNRIKRRTLRSRRDNDKRVMVLVAAAHTADRPTTTDPLASHEPLISRPTNRAFATGDALAALAEAHARAMEAIAAAHAGEVAGLQAALTEARLRADSEAGRADRAEARATEAEAALRAALARPDPLRWFLGAFQRVRRGD